MTLLLSKLLPPLLFPAGLTVVLCLLAAGLAFRKGARVAGIVSLLAALVLYTAASPIASQWLLKGLERQYPPSVTHPKASAIVLLGGGMAPFAPPRVHPETNWAGDRLLHAGRLWRQDLAPVLIVTGGYIPFLTEDSGSEAALYADLLHELFDVPRESMLLVPDSRTTLEDASITARLLEARGMEKEILLVTSASHMVRAAAVFRRQGFVVHPAPTDFYGLWNRVLKPIDFLPSGRALAETGIALHEYLGLAAYKVLGRL